MGTQTVGIVAVAPGSRISKENSDFDPVRTVDMLKSVGILVPARFRISDLEAAVRNKTHSVFAACTNQYAFLSSDDLFGAAADPESPIIQRFLRRYEKWNILAFEVSGVASYTAYSRFVGGKLVRLVISNPAVDCEVRNGSADLEEIDAEKNGTAEDALMATAQRFFDPALDAQEMALVVTFEFKRGIFGDYLRRLFASRS